MQTEQTNDSVRSNPVHAMQKSLTPLPTMEDVARQAGVSKSTVSLALNDKPGISAELKQTILRAAADLGYRLAKTRLPARASATRTVAVVHSEPHQPPSGNPEPTGLYLRYLDGIRAYTQSANLNLTVIADYRDGDTQGLAFQLLHGETAAFDGFLFMGWSARQGNRLVQQTLQRGLPAVALSRSWPGLPISTVGPDYQQQVQLAIDYLAGLGHRQIAFLAREEDRRYEWFGLRVAAYEETMRRLNGRVDSELIVLGATGKAAVETLLARRAEVTAIFAGNDDFALEVIGALQALGILVPAQLSVIGQDNLAAQKLPGMTLTTVGFSHFHVGYLAADLLRQQIESDALAYGNLWVRSYLVEGSSCAAPQQVVD
jgi:DNA-binding LacI/PurR family transcriptional regulator